MLLCLLHFAEEDTPSTTVTPLPHLQTMSNFKEGEIKTGAGLSTGEGKNSNYQTVLNHKRCRFQKLLNNNYNVESLYNLPFQ